MKIRIAFELFIVVCGLLCSSDPAQSVLQQRKKYQVDPRKPSVYLEVKKIPRKPRNPASVRGNRVFIRLYNNLKWPIRLTVSPAGEGEGDARMNYVFLDQNELPLDGFSCHVCTEIPLGSGKSLLFSIPQNEITHANRIRVQFSFWWEDSRLEGTDRLPLHYVALTLEPEG